MSKKRTPLSDGPWANELEEDKIKKTLNNVDKKINKIEEKLSEIEMVVNKYKENEEIKDNQNDKLAKIKSFVAQPAIFALIITAIFYIVITNYYINYFNKLSLPFFILNLPLNFYLNAAYKILIFISYLCIAMVFIMGLYRAFKDFPFDGGSLYILILFIPIFGIALIFSLLFFLPITANELFAFITVAFGPTIFLLTFFCYLKF